ncbi:uncharacterized protein LOC111893226 [Lactuca sativa]|uniref:uncharacterized protein LOC111893226 n=1 Tax=Lactuca sativa TaxID=4236 RepID=UPI000CD84CA2|nr:uncharacterized protein LOC111893226 [Lactuca sativa]
MSIFRKKKSKLPNPKAIDRVICAELSDKKLEPDLYQIVSDNMIHGPCGNDFPFMPCMKNGKCPKVFPKDFTNDTYIDDDGYPVYRRRDNGNNVVKNGVSLDNRYIVPYNKTLLKQYQAHMNLEWCNQLGSIKYHFKYINKGPNRITAYGIHYRTQPVERLSCHLQDKQLVFKPSQRVANVVSKPTIVASQFLAWMEYKVWTRRKTKTNSFGRIDHVSPKSGDVCYLRILLNKVKGPTCYEDIRTVNGTVYDSYKNAY